jgi:hypothetical protein
MNVTVTCMTMIATPQMRHTKYNLMQKIQIATSTQSIIHPRIACCFGYADDYDYDYDYDF